MLIKGLPGLTGTCYRLVPGHPMSLNITGYCSLLLVSVESQGSSVWDVHVQYLRSSSSSLLPLLLSRKLSFVAQRHSAWWQHSPRWRSEKRSQPLELDIMMYVLLFYHIDLLWCCLRLFTYFNTGGWHNCEDNWPTTVLKFPDHDKGYG